jgi:hypothetical protein
MKTRLKFNRMKRIFLSYNIAIGLIAGSLVNGKLVNHCRF